MTKISTGSQCFDTFLEGGYDEDIITTVYGPSGVGKTNMCLLCAISVVQQGKKVIFIDTEGGIAVERIKQLAVEYEQVLENILFCNPATFEEQKEIFERVKEMVNEAGSEGVQSMEKEGSKEEYGLIIVDSISMLYRLELGKNEEVYDVNTALGRQIAYLVEIARKKKIPVLITNQVYADFDNRDKVKMVGGDLLKYGSKCLIELMKFANCRGAVLRKHRSLPEGRELKFMIVEKGIEIV
jgi:DNA repair protein RadB